MYIDILVKNVIIYNIIILCIIFMNIEFLLSAKFNRALPTKDRLFKSIVSSLNEVNINPQNILS